MAGRDRIALPPSNITGPLGAYLLAMAQAINAIPTMSYFSGTHPNSSVTGIAGHIAVNVSPASNVSRLFLKYGSIIAPDQGSWETVA